MFLRAGRFRVVVSTGCSTVIKLMCLSNYNNKKVFENPNTREMQTIEQKMPGILEGKLNGMEILLGNFQNFG